MHHIINPRFTFVMLSKFILQAYETHPFIMYSSTKYVRNAAMGQLFVKVTQPKKITINVWIYSN